MADLFDIRGGTMNLATTALTGLSGGATTGSTTGTPAYMLKGVIKASTNQSGGATPTTDISTGDAFVALATGEGCLFVFGWDSSASTVFSVAQGKVVKAADVTNGAAAYEFPSIPDTFCPTDYVTISYVGASTWTFGTSNWNATTATIGTVIHIGILPTQPLTAASA